MGKNFQYFQSRKAFTLIDVLVSVGILVVLFGGIYLIYFSILDVINNLELRTAATSILNQEVEIIRNLAYEDVGTLGGVPTGAIPQTQIKTFDNLSFSIKTIVRNIDDPFDGILGGSPNDTAPADYKLVELEIDCINCKKFVPLLFTTTVAPKNLESASNDGSLFINVFDAGGMGIQGATVRVVNSNVSPTIDLTDLTNTNGVLQLVGVPTSTQSYSILVLKEGYSSDQTYPLGGVDNPNPSKPHATVAAQTVTSISFAIDRVSTLNLISSGFRCEPIPSTSFSIQGSKIIGTVPDVYKFSTTTITNAQGLKTFSNLEWDTYSVSMTDDSFDIYGMNPLAPIAINPSSTMDLRFTLVPADPRSLLVTVKNAVTGDPIADAEVDISTTGFSDSVITGRAVYSDSDWSGGDYANLNGSISADIVPGLIRLIVNASGTYDTGVVGWIESNTIDFGSASTTFHNLEFLPTSQPPSTGSDSLRIQIASNNDNTTWNFSGPDGAGSTYYTVSGGSIWSGHDGKRYVRYRVYLSTQDENQTPELSSININFSGFCVPKAQTVFQNLPLGTYDVLATASGFQTGSSTVSVSGDWQQVEVLMEPQ